MGKPALSKLIAQTTVLFLPIIYFCSIFVLTIGASFYLISHPQAIKNLKYELLTYSLFNSPPKDGIVLGSSTIRAEARPVILKKYLQYHRSGLETYSDLLLAVADKYSLDWRLLPAIAGQESTFCRTIPDDSHNCWGWAITEDYTKKFSGFEEAIERVGKSLREDYLDSGLETPAEIMTKYTPKSLEKGGAWAKGVEYFMWELENFPF